MALINCPSCTRQLSDQASSCPQCGHPLQSTKNVYVTNVKKGKGKKLVGGLLIFLSILILIGSTSSHSGSGLGVFLLFIGIIVSLYGKIEHWWHWK